MKTTIIKLAWKNIWRNKIRSGMILGAIAIGLFSGTFITAFISGWMNNRIVSDINDQIAYIQIHQSGFTDNNELSAYFTRSEVEKQVQSVSAITNVSHRLKISGMVASANNAVGVFAKAVDVAKEKAVSNLYQSIPDSLGSFLEGDGKMQIVISRRTAEKLKVKLKSKVVFTFQDNSGEIQSLAFRVGGLFKTTNVFFDESTVFIKSSDIFSYIGLPEDAVHETAIMINDFDSCKQATTSLKKLLPNMNVQSWASIQPELALMLSWLGLYNIIILSIFLTALSFGLVNTMLMAVLERTHELGMLMCIGMNKKRIFRMIMLETLFITCVGSIVGILVALIVINVTSKTGIDLTFMLKDNFEDYGFGSIIYPLFNIRTFIQIVVMILIGGVLSAIYPARKALELDPLDAMKH